jgi:septum formation topological specificity factor MinE
VREREEDEEELLEDVSGVDGEVVAQPRHGHEAAQLALHRLAALRRQLVAVLQRHVLVPITHSSHSVKQHEEQISF